jgi:hypothetical protein
VRSLAPLRFGREPEVTAHVLRHDEPRLARLVPCGLADLEGRGRYTREDRIPEAFVHVLALELAVSSSPA